MALITCSVCEEEYSAQEPVCPKCGCPNPELQATAPESSEAPAQPSDPVELEEKPKRWFSVKRNRLLVAALLGLAALLLAFLVSTGGAGGSKSEKLLSDLGLKYGMTDKQVAKQIEVIREKNEADTLSLMGSRISVESGYDFLQYDSTADGKCSVLFTFYPEDMSSGDQAVELLKTLVEKINTQLGTEPYNSSGSDNIMVSWLTEECNVHLSLEVMSYYGVSYYVFMLMMIKN